LALSLPLLAALAVMAAPQDSPQAAPPQSAPAQLGDIEVRGTVGLDMARTFVNRVAAPSRGRGLGHWGDICPIVVNLERELAQAIVDRIAATAIDLGVGVREAGCNPDVVIVFSPDNRAVLNALVANEPTAFRTGDGVLDRGAAALRDLRNSSEPVLWWLSSMPIDSDTRQRAVRLKGDTGGGVVPDYIASLVGCHPDDCALAAVPVIRSAGGASRLNTRIIDQIYKAIVLVDIQAVAGLNTAQLGDYLAMVSLAQVDPGAGTEAFDTILNLFDDPAHVAGMTAWDRAYLEALYGPSSQRRSPRAQAAAVAAIMNRNPDIAPAP
jgi:hypothetical protein